MGVVANTMLALALVMLVTLSVIVATSNTKRPKPFDFEGWDNGLVKRCD